jgi:hypothetical protein
MLMNFSKILLLLTVFLYSTIYFSQSSEEINRIFEISMKNTQGSETNLKEELESNGLIVVFSCNTCPFVVGNDNFKGWEKDYNELYKLAKEAKLGFVLINSNEAKRDNEDSFDEMEKHAKKMKYKMPYLVDVNSDIANILSAKTTPHVYVFNTKKEIIYKGSIDNSWDTSRKEDNHYLKDNILNIKDKKTIDLTESEPRGCSIKRKK